jgi:23S rRNA (cytidine1920-2'-O)/16S rRNA (cytidine1409-2'-O)-methyltransferase
MKSKSRLDVLLVEHGLVESRTKAQALIMAGKIQVDGQIATKAGTQIPVNANLTVKQDLPYVSRGGLKLIAALDACSINPKGVVCADVGASTGGFTDVLLQHGATKVYAIDVGYGQLAWKLRQNPKVVVMERTNARHLQSLPESISLATIDVSFISLRLILPAVIRWLTRPAVIIALVKPQFEAGKNQVGKGGVVRDKAVHQQVLENVATYADDLDLTILGLIPSPITGATGNQEFLMIFGWQTSQPAIDMVLTIKDCGL